MLPPFPYDALLGWYRKNGRHGLPWRKDVTPYKVWLSEILLQQTQAPRVAAFFERIVTKWPTVESLAAATYEEFFPYYDGLGYYSRARNLLAAAKVVAGEYGGKFPSETEKLLKLPGVGPYTAEAIRAFAFGIPTLSFDTNLEKVFSRYYFGNRFRKLTAAEKTEVVADFHKSGVSSRDANAALMDFANLVSFNAKAKIDWNSYPFPDCRFFQTRGTEEPENRTAKTSFPMKDSKLVAILADAHGKTLFSSEPEGYEPFVLEPTEGDPREAIKRFFLDRGLAVSVRPPYSKGFLGGAPLAFFRVRVQTGMPEFGTVEKSRFSEWWKNQAGGVGSDFSIPPA
jgi:A/G-specific adenine glycosylase